MTPLEMAQAITWERLSREPNIHETQQWYLDRLVSSPSDSGKIMQYIGIQRGW